MTDSTFPAAFGRYQPIEELGSGAMGRVYLAIDPLIDRMVAVKVINVALLAPGDRDEFLARFRTEVRAAAHCAHPGIVAVHDFADDGPVPYIVMEHVPGQTLSAILRQPAEARRTAVPGLVASMLDVLAALAAAHALGVVHRDIKPGNIMVTPRGVVKITDFGIARMGESSLTLVGGTIGSPGYMAPEQALGHAVDHRADLFSTAAVLYEILIGRPPFAGASMTETLMRLSSPEPADLGPLSGTPIGAVLARGLRKGVAQRFASAADFASALRQALAAPADGDATILAPRLPTEASGLTKAAPLPFATRTTPGLALDAAKADRIVRELAFLVGPIARLMVSRAAKHACNLPDLIALICDGVAPEEAKALRARLAALDQ